MSDKNLSKYIKNLVREEMSHVPFGKEQKEGNPIDHIRKTREGIEQSIANIEDLMNMITKHHPDMAGWLNSIVEDQKDVYEELMDLETRLRTSKRENKEKSKDFKEVVRETIYKVLSEKVSKEYCENTPKSEMGFTQRASCKAQGYIARSDGEKRKSDKYK